MPHDPTEVDQPETVREKELAIKVDELERRVRELEGRNDFGLTWEHLPEDVDALLRAEVPVLIAKPTLSIAGAIPSDRSHALIEGDNLHALHTLQATHRELIDVIYIDPPYNTGHEFKYNDKIIDKEHVFRHSAWLSFMDKRLRLAKNLLKKSGLIVISIDDHEQANLRLLCDEVFGESNFIACLPTIMNLKGNQDQFGFAGTHEYTLVYARSKADAEFGELQVDDEALLDEWQQDDVGWWKKGAGLKATGGNAPREKRPNLWYPLYVAADGAYVDSVRRSQSDDEIFPITDGQEMSWRWQASTAHERSADLIATGSSPNWTVYKKQRPGLGDMPSRKPKSIFYRPEYSSTNGTNTLKKLLGGRPFPNPKPVELIVDLLTIATRNKDALLLDFFAGSGTTLHATALLNSRDGGNRCCIMVTNNENDICREVTHPRAKAVLTGKWADGEHDPLPGTLLFYETDFIERRRNLDAMREKIASHTVDMVSLREAASSRIDLSPGLSILYGDVRTIAVVSTTTPDHESLLAEANSHVRPDDDRIAYLFTWSDSGIEPEVADQWNGWEVAPLPSQMLAALRKTVPQPNLFEDGGEELAR
jgi:adenine-specific DNA-methyltransferase